MRRLSRRHLYNGVLAALWALGTLAMAGLFLDAALSDSGPHGPSPAHPNPLFTLVMIACAIVIVGDLFVSLREEARARRTRDEPVSPRLEEGFHQPDPGPIAFVPSNKVVSGDIQMIWADPKTYTLPQGSAMVPQGTWTITTSEPMPTLLTPPSGVTSASASADTVPLHLQSPEERRAQIKAVPATTPEEHDGDIDDGATPPPVGPPAEA
jgi:hypothetical protein